MHADHTSVPLQRSPRGKARPSFRILALLGVLGLLIVVLSSVLPTLVERQRIGPRLPERLALSSQTGLAAALSYGSTQPGLLTLSEPAKGKTLASRLGASIRLADERVLNLSSDFIPSDATGSRPKLVVDPVLGSAEHVAATYRSADQSVVATLELTLGQEREALLYQLRAAPSAASAEPQRFAMFGGNDAAFDLVGPVEYLTLLSPRAVAGQIDGTHTHAVVPLAQGGPMLLWSDATQTGYVLGSLDTTEGSVFVQLSRRGSRRTSLEIHTGPREIQPNASPRIYLERVHTRDLTKAFAGYRGVLDVIAPAPPIPPGFRQQWDSWYAFLGDIDEERLREVIDVLSSKYGDLGPWQMVVDAGWYLAGANPDGEIGVVDPDKFPSGMRALVDYAHERRVSVVLYGSAPWVDSRPSNTSWWVVQLGFVRDHPDWLVLVDEDEEGATFVYDLSNPELRAYLRERIAQYLREFDADGIQLDMVGVIGASGGPFRGEPASRAQVRQLSLAQTMTVYRSLWWAAQQAKPGAWIESGYATPPLARSYAHAWRLADDFPEFSHPYPFAGLVEQVTYAALQRQMLGRRPHLGYIYGAEETLPIQRQWLGAAVALQAQVALSVDLRHTSPATSRMYREYLAALRPFSTMPTFGPGSPPEAFSSVLDGTLYVDLLNTADTARQVDVDVAHHGMQEAQLIAFDPETGQAFSTSPKLSVNVQARSFRLLVLRADPGVLWADRAWSSVWDQDELVIRVEPGPDGPGRLRVYVPGVRSVRIEGGASAFWSQNSVGLLTVDVPDGSAYDIHLTFGASRE